MAAISSIPDMLNVAVGDYKAFKITAGQAITRGTVLGIDQTYGWAVPQPIATTGTGAVIGVAMDSVPAYEKVTVIYDGVVNVANALDGTAITQGGQVKVGSFAGAVVVASTTAPETNTIGQVLETIAANSYGKILLKLR